MGGFLRRNIHRRNSIPPSAECPSHRSQYILMYPLDSARPALLKRVVPSTVFLRGLLLLHASLSCGNDMAELRFGGRCRTSIGVSRSVASS